MLLKTLKMPQVFVQFLVAEFKSRIAFMLQLIINPFVILTNKIIAIKSLEMKKIVIFSSLLNSMFRQYIALKLIMLYIESANILSFNFIKIIFY